MMEHGIAALDALFSPPEGRYGTHMALCAMTADIDTLNRALSSFTGQEALTRAATGWPRAVLMLDASQPLPSASAVPGMVCLAHDGVEQWQRRTTLMHAKVALLAFADQPMGAPTSFRLVVSTGNWTRESWGTMSLIDMYWTCEWNCAELRTQEQSDVGAAYDFLDRLMQGLYARSARAFGEGLSWWGDWRVRMSREGIRLPASRFVHSLDQSLYEHIKRAMRRADFHTVIAGSGFFERPETDATSGAMPQVLQSLDEIVEIGQAREKYLVFNPDQAGALATWGAHNRAGWNLCIPTDPLGEKFPGCRNLHAKFIVGLSRWNRDDGKLGFLYLGSGNLSRLGLLSRAGLDVSSARGDAGNIETGIVTNEELKLNSVWRSLACGDYLADHPARALEPGEGEPLHTPLPPPPVLLARHEAQQLLFVRSGDASAFQFQLPGSDQWLDVTADQDAVPWEGPTPMVLAVRRKAGDLEKFELPVMSAGGALCRQTLPELAADDVLEGLLQFPDAPAYAIDTIDDGSGTGATRVQQATSARMNYPLRWLASVIEAIGDRQSSVTPEQFPIWISQVRMLLLEQVAPLHRKQIRDLHLDLFPALLEEGFRPSWLIAEHPLLPAYQALVEALRSFWSLPEQLRESGADGHEHYSASEAPYGME